MRGKYKIIVKITSFIFIFLLIFISLSFLFIPKGNNKGFGVDKFTGHGIHAEEKETIDVVFVGDSESYTNFSPLYIFENYGYTSYVCGTSGQKLFTSLEFVSKVIETQTPEVIFLETNAIFRKLKPGEAEYAFLERYIPLLRYHNTWKDFNPLAIFKKPKLNRDYLKGHKPRFGMKAANLDGYMAPTSEHEIIPKENLVLLNKIVELAKDNKAELILVSTPSPLNWNMKRHNRIEKYAIDNSLSYIDLNLTDINIDWSKDTYDRGDHLNYNGTVKVSSFIGDYLNKSEHKLIDQRANELYKPWFNDIKRYKEIISLRQSIYN